FWRRLKIIRQIAIHELGVVSLVNRKVVQYAIGVMEGQVEGRTADQRGHPGHRFLAAPPPLVETVEPPEQYRFLEGVPDFNRMARRADVGPQLGQFNTKLFQCCMTLLIWNGARPDPLDAQR